MQTSSDRSQEGRPSVVFEGELMVVNGQSISYCNQMLRRDGFYLTDLGIDLPLEEGIDEFDRRYFDYMLTHKLVKEIEIQHPKVGLQLLQQLPSLTEKDYANLIVKLSTLKTKQLLMQTDCFLHLWQVLAALPQPPKPLAMTTSQAAVFLADLDQPYQRILFMLEYLPTTNSVREALSTTASEMVEQIFTNRRLFLETLSGHKNQGNKWEQADIGQDFLINIRKTYQTLILMTQNPQETFEQYFDKNMQKKTCQGLSLSNRLFSRQCLNLIAFNFEQLLNFDRKNLITVLSLIASEKGQAIWAQLISKPYLPKQTKSESSIKKSLSDSQLKTSEVQSSSNHCTKNNELNFIILIQNNFYEPGQPQWEESLLILEALVRYSANESQHVLIRIFLEISQQNQIDVSFFGLAVEFIQTICGKQGRNDRNVQLFVIELMSDVNLKINSQLKSEQLIAFLKIYRTIIELKLGNVVSEVDCIRPLEHLLAVTKSRTGMVESARRAFLNKAKGFLLTELASNQKTIDFSRMLGKRSNRDFSLLNPKEDRSNRFVAFLKTLK